MRKILILVIILNSATIVSGQKADLAEFTPERNLKIANDIACNCVDSIVTFDVAKSVVVKKISNCIDKSVDVYSLSLKMIAAINGKLTTEDAETGKKKVDIVLNTDKNSAEYKANYSEIEKYMMAHCDIMKAKLMAEDKLEENAYSDDKEARKAYNEGITEMEEGKYKSALKKFKKAIEIDKRFIFAWDNLGICYRKMEDYDNAISAYKSSLDLNPNGLTPLQNIAVVYELKGDYNSAIASYEKMSKLDASNPEPFFGIGRVQALSLKDLEKGLDNMCKAYRLYIAQKSPYRTDAEKVISTIYSEMKKENQLEKFNAILKQHDISTE